MTDRPLYRHAPIYSTGALGRALGYSEQSLLEIARRAPKMYIGPIEKPKKNGGTRYVFDTRFPLKPLLKKINTTFFQRVEFPAYLTGSIKARDYATNAKIHENSAGAITEDISDFFPSIRRDAA